MNQFYFIRRWFFLAGVFHLGIILWVGVAGFETMGGRSAFAAEESDTKTQAERIDELFDSLKREPNQEKASRIATEIRMNWLNQGSDSVNALMDWAQQAMEDSRYNVALDLLNQVIVLFPTYVEGWNRRATLHYITGDYQKSMADIAQTLALEPRHFGALMGMAKILSVDHEDHRALEVYERVLAIYPAHKNARDSLVHLLQKLEKNEI